MFANLLTLGPERLNGVEWESLIEKMDGIIYIGDEVTTIVTQFHKEQSSVTEKVRTTIKPTQIYRTIQSLTVCPEMSRAELRFGRFHIAQHSLFVAQTMANTYTEVSSRYIIPGVDKIDRLSLPGAKNMSKEERADKIVEVGELAKRARRDVKPLANVVSYLPYS